MLEGINIYIKNSSRMKKRGINVYIKKDGVYVYKSKFVTKKEVDNFLEEIQSQIIKAYNKINSKLDVDLLDSNKIMYKGKIFNIECIKADKEKVILDTYNKLFNVYIKEKNIDNKEYLNNTLKKYLANNLKEFVSLESMKYAEKMNVK